MRESISIQTEHLHMDLRRGKCQVCWKIVDLYIKSSIIRFQMQIIRRLLQQMRAETGMILKSVLHFMTEIQIHLLPEKSA